MRWSCLLVGLLLPGCVVARGLRPQPPTSTSSTQPSNSVINVHIIAHTHDDVGWLKTIDQYFNGQNETIQHACVRCLIDSVMDSLAKNPDRKFIYVEMAFFWRWWSEQTPARKQQVRDFVKNGQLEFINGGWCMHDEATPHFQSMVDQTTEGHSFLLREFGVTPTVQWQIDPFGHSSANAELSKQMGLDSLFFARADYEDYNRRRDASELEMVWFPLQSRPELNIFTHLMLDHYGPPDGFDWDVYNAGEPVQDNKNLFDYNVESRVNDFVNYCTSKASHFKTNNIILTMGSDFHYRQAENWFGNLDKIIKYSNQLAGDKLNVFYSTPSQYVNAVLAASPKLPTKSDDFFPYGDNPHGYWTGYFTSRPAHKRYDRYAMNYLQACKQIEAQQGHGNSSWLLREGAAVNQHHDAVSGTEKQHVAFDYARRLSIGIDSCEAMIGKALADWSGVQGTLSNCHLLNVSVCAQSVTNTGAIQLVLYNPLSQPRTEVIRIPVSLASGAAVTDPNGNNVPSQVYPNTQATIDLGTLENHNDTSAVGGYTVAFSATIPAMGYALYTVNLTAPSSEHSDPLQQASVNSRAGVKQADVTIENQFLQLTFSGATGRLSGVVNKKDGSEAVVDQHFYQYFSSVGNAEHDQRSGAYIFRPNQMMADPLGWTATIDSVVRGALVQEVRQTFGSYNVTQIVRLYDNSPFAEFEWTVGPIGAHDGWGKEIVTRFTTDINHAGVWFTDSNGREMQRRVRNFRPSWTTVVTEPAASNFYPLNTAAYFEDSSRRLTVITDRSQGCGSVWDGQLEVMVHRRTMQDDSRGVDEPIAEPGLNSQGLIVRGRHWVLLTKPENGPALHKPLVQRLTYEPVILFGKSAAAPTNTTQSFLGDAIDPSLHVLTKQLWDEDRKAYLVRVNHLYQISEDPELSSSATISLDSLFPGNKIARVTELMLSANQPAKNASPLAANHTATLSAMDIRTFEVVLA